jgi:hypothetical protein
MLESENSSNMAPFSRKTLGRGMGCYGFVVRPTFVTWGRTVHDKAAWAES